MTKNINFCMAGFGNVGVRFMELLLEKESEIRAKYDCEFHLTGISTRTKGTLLNPDGLDMRKILAANYATDRFDQTDAAFVACGTEEMIDKADADLFIEATTLSIEDGEPATGYIKRSLNKGMDVITANKGPEAWNFNGISALAKAKGRNFLYETIVMDGTPIFNLVEDTLQGNKIVGMRGILNGTTNFVLGELEKGICYDDAIKEAQRIQLAEADPSMDVDGWDGAAKICALANILMDAQLTPKDVHVESLAQITVKDIEQAKSGGYKIKYICSAEYSKETGRLELKVKPTLLSTEDILCCINGTSAALTLYTDLAGEISIVQTNPGILQTAYGVYSDLLRLIKLRQQQ